MKNNQWSTKHKCCIECETTETKHVSRGRCQNCYSRHRYATIPEVKEKIYKYNDDWRKNNPDKSKKILCRASRKYYAKNNPNVKGRHRKREFSVLSQTDKPMV